MYGEEMTTDQEKADDHIVDACAECYDFEARIGTGSQGEVWRARDRRTGKAMALKLLKLCGDSQNELRAHRHLSRTDPHPCVLGLAASFMDR